MADLPVVVVGAGPIGMAAAVHLLARDLQPMVIEAGSGPASAVAQWGHVRLFSPWPHLIDPRAAERLSTGGWRRPDPDVHPTGADWLDGYLCPLAATLTPHIRYRTRVTGVARSVGDRAAGSGDAEQPFTVRLASRDGESMLTARAVIDASGTWGRPRPLGDGQPAPGEGSVRERISYRIPELGDPAVRSRYAGQRVAVVGSGHSAQTALIALAELADEQPGTRVTWLLRRPPAAAPGGETDQLPARAALGDRAASAARSPHVSTVAGFKTAVVNWVPDWGVVLESADGRQSEPFDEVVVLTGFEPDLSWLDDVRLDLDPVLLAPRGLAPLIDPAVHSCGTVQPHGARELAQPEPGLFTVGMKSYGCAPTFLASIGYEQVRSVVAAIAGDHEAAARTEFTLSPATACGTGESGACGPLDCTPGGELIQLTVPSRLRS